MSAIDPTVATVNSDAIVVNEINQLSENFIDPSVFNPFHGQESDTDAQLDTQAGIPPLIPIPPFPISRLAVSGRYRGTWGSYELELRIDVDRDRPLNKVSGDFYQTVGAVKNYYGSFVLNTPITSYGTTLVNIEGFITGTFSVAFPYVKISIPRNIIFLPAANATLSFFSNASGTMGATYVNTFESRFFRTVQYEQDNVAGITPFVSYNTGSLTSGGAARTLSVAGAYAECGIEMQNTGGTNIVSAASIGASWSDSELHTAMVNNFTSWTDQPNWRVWLLEAVLHDLGPGLYGIMFDQQGKQRQGCAVFHTGIGGNTAAQQRLQLYTYVHELGHSFNLLHSWQKHRGTPGVPSRPNSLSWMNYPWNIAAFGTPANFWNNFAFQFDTEEVTHLRHAFRNNVIMGGSNFAVGSALHQHGDLSDFQAPVEDNSGLNFRIETRKSYAFGEPVVVDLKLSTYDSRGKMVNARLHPNFDFVRIAIQKPNNEVVVYEPLMEHLALADVKTIGIDDAVYESAYIGFGKSGFTFDQTGFYTIKAVYLSMDGSPVVSNELSLRVKSPVTITEDEIADSYFGDDQGHLFYLLGSDSDSLKNGNAAFDLVIDKYAKNPLSSYASLIKGINASRNYKTVTGDKTMNVRSSDENLNQKMIEQVVKHSKGNDGVDNITLNMAMRNMASCQKDAGNEQAASETLTEMVGIFENKGLKPDVIADIKVQAQMV